MTGGREPAFDAYAENYEAALADGLRYAGEDSAYFARGRVQWLRRRVTEIGVSARNVIDFGCGTGSTTPLLLDVLGAERVIGADVSNELLRRARAECSSRGVEFRSTEQALDSWADVAYCNGVFHHIEPAERLDAVRWVWRALRPGGLFGLWENNPWNPGARLVMSRIEFDRDATMLRPGETRKLLKTAGFDVLGTDSLFYFPRALRALRNLEPGLARVPLGAQYMVLARREG